MKKRHTTPGVYLQGLSPQPRPIAQVATAIPAFIGYTEKSIHRGIQVMNTPIQIRSVLEFEEFFGKAFPSKFEIVPTLPDDAFPINIDGQIKSISFLPDQQGFLYYSVKAFFENGGGTCYIVSVGNYTGEASLIIEKSALLGGLTALDHENTPLILVIPDAVLLGDLAPHLYQQMLAHCASKRNRFAILDIPDGYQSLNGGNDCISDFRNGIGIQNLAFGAVYYPWLYSSIAFDPSMEVLDRFTLLDLQNILTEPHAQTFLNSTPAPYGSYLDQGLRNFSPTYLALLEAIQKKLGLLPPSGFLAGVYARTDQQRGVWKAPANVSLNSVFKTSSSVTAVSQRDLNIHPSGKSINAIREFPGKGILVWGARTLAGNNNEWRYVPVRRTAMMVEQSIRDGIQFAVFEPNTSNTWLTIKNSSTNFLTSIWRSGGLAGARAKEAFYVQVGLGKTMTAEDISNNRMIVEIGMAILRPAEFIVLRIELNIKG